MDLKLKIQHSFNIPKHVPNWFEKLIELIGFFFAMTFSQLLLNNPFYGASFYEGLKLMLLYFDILSKQGKALLPNQERIKYLCCMPFVVLIMICLVFLYPVIIKEKNTLYVLIFITLMFIIFHFASLDFIRGTRLARRKELYDGFMAGETGCTPEEINDMMKVHSYRLYWRMTANAKAAFEMSILFAICYLPYLPFHGFWRLITDIFALISLYALAGLISKLVLWKKPLLDLGKNTVFIIFSVVWISVNYYLHKNYDKLSDVHFYLAFLILCICIIAIATVEISMESDMEIIESLGIKGFTPRKFEILKALIDHLSTFYSSVATLVIISFLAFFNKLNPDKSSGTAYVMSKYGFSLIPVFFLIISVFAAVRQPLNRLYEQKLKKYIFLETEGKPNTILENRLRAVLVEKYRKRFGIRLLMIILKPLFHHKVIGKENVDTNVFPSIFVCNHSQIYGPVAAILNIPFDFKPWILNEMVDNEKIADHIQKGTFDRQKWIPKPLRNKMGKIFGPVIAWAMQSAEPIPVRRNEGRDMLKVISMSVDALEADDNILIFPENPFMTEGYVVEGVGEFFSGFVNIARDYYRKTGKAVTFYSVFANKKKRTLTFSKGIAFDPEVSFKEEKERITNILHCEMLKMAE